jgi:RecA/RadA recombinase
MGGAGFFIDTEKSWDEYRAAQIGIDVDNEFGIIDADSVDAVFRMIQRTLNQRKKHNDNKPFVIVVDSVTGAATEEMHAKEIGAAERVGQDAKAIRGGMRRVVPSLAETNVTLIMVNHATANITSNKYAKQSDSSGGHSIKLAATVRCAMKGAGWIKNKADDGRRDGQKVSIKIEKLKNSMLAYPEIKETPLLNTIGFDLEASLLEAGKKAGWVEHKPNAKFYTFEGQNFAKSEWGDIVMQLGGPDAAYKKFLAWCIEQGSISPWGMEIG